MLSDLQIEQSTPKLPIAEVAANLGLGESDFLPHGRHIAKLPTQIRQASLAVREPSLGPYFGIKGGGTGAGRAQVVPAEDINLHFTGDIGCVQKSANLLAAMIDNHIHHQNKLDIDPRRVTWKRVVDLNDRALRDIIIGLGGPQHGVPRKDGFYIAPASEVMAILCLATDFRALRARIRKIIFGLPGYGSWIRYGSRRREVL